MLGKKIIAIITSSLLIVGVISGVVFQIIINSEVQNTVNETAIDVTSIELLNATDNSIFMRLNITITNPKSVDATLDPFILTLSYNSVVIGNITIPSLDISSATTIITLDAILNPVNQEIFNYFVKAFITEENLDLRIYGETIIHAKAALLSVSSSAVINKTLTFTGLNGLKGIRITDIELLNNTMDAIFTNVGIEVFNPSLLSIDLTNVQFDLNYKDSKIGNISFSNLNLVPGNNVFEKDFELRPDNLTAMQELVTNFLSDKNSTIDVYGSFNVEPQGLIENALSEVHFTTVLIGQGNIELSLNNFKLYKLSASEIEGQVNITLYNPTNVEGNISAIYLDVIYSSEKLGTMLIRDINLLKGSNILVTNFTFTPENFDVLTTFTSAYLSGTDIELIIKGSESGNTLSSLLSGWQQIIHISIAESFNITINEIGILNSTSSSVFLRTGLVFYNPTNVNVELVNATFEVIWTDMNATLGLLRLPYTELRSGFNEIKEDVELIPDNVSVVTNLINSYLSGNKINLTLIGCSSEKDLLSQLLNDYRLNFTLPPISPLDIVVVSLDFYNISSSRIDFNVTIDITNPSATSVTVSNLTFQADYQSLVLGNIAIDTMTVNPGKACYNVIVTFSVTNDSLLADLLTKYINGEQITLTLECVQVEADILSNVIRDYVSEIQLPVLDLGIDVTDILLVNSTAETISTDLEVSLFNPTSFSITLNNITFDLFYYGLKIGNATATEVVLQPGNNIVTLNGILTAEYNRTNIEVFLSQYVNGYDVLVEVVGNFTSSFSGLIPEVTIDFNQQKVIAGLESLVQSVVVDDISINLQYIPPATVTVSYDVILNISIINTMSFNIELVSWGGDVYFNDTDDSSYYILSYPAKYNIYLTTVNVTGLTEVLTPQDVTILQYTYSDNDVEKGVRLNDELEKNKLYIALINGWITVKIGDFEVTLNFEMYDIHVTT